ncbi:FAD-binding oxidoreductase [Thioflexithrix psekupsensis]|uniref:FAD-binding oxidoreductase n=1 Tax=Thioflexithrix psekupsensis TaxID=1570016 RepID=A0A251X5P4_9GAMM|nr:FAD-binding oxidoreductase [Thioflexithrix psekupsensis]
MHHTPCDKRELLSQFLTFLPKNAVLSEPEDLHPYECDGLSAFRHLPMMVVLPESVAQVQQIMRVCYERRVPVIARGAGTGLSGSALPDDHSVLLSLSKLNRILELDPLSRTARIEPGVRNLAITEAASQYGLYYAPDPSSQIACSIGGNVAENSGGVHCLKYGLTVHNVLALKVVMVTGELLHIGSGALDSPGYHLLALMHGSEGMLGIVVEVLVKLVPKPNDIQVLLITFDDVAQAGRAVNTIIESGILPSGLEMMDQLAIRAAEDFCHAGYPTDVAAILLCELDGTTEEVDEHVKKVEQLMQNCGALAVRVAKTEAERILFWKGRKSAFPAVGRLSPDYYCMDGTIPRRHLAAVLTRLNELSQEYNLPIANVFHAGDGNLHPLIMYDANIPGELARTEELGGKILTLCVEMGGTITGEHGVGVEKINQMCDQFASAELQQFHAIKEAFDPLRLLNPGKAVPTLHRCAELGAMHVHHNQLPHSDLPRF